VERGTGNFAPVEHQLNCNGFVYYISENIYVRAEFRLHSEGKRVIVRQAYVREAQQMAEKMAEAKSRELTKFGALVLSLAAERGITKQTKIAALVSEETQEDVNQRRLSGWLHGDHEPPWWFCDALATKLNLSDAEMERLAWTNTYLQKTSVEEK
jgi:hypothetical protein